ncbi:MAG: response regulator transcription factor [Pseudomonadales bacterium]|jgi:two-component system OmpR family response regulator|nr:response regulator transcription factor [Pseudomonadales bacterium]MDP6472983.1 response regulator transcription factor [Pseudomonadales bacterium]MDP6826261.1 response regulator transcription factor [Pseudomonadales bacterium]MDP6970809.1 response regulator transcription factor [Pseudomonadales bacterium]|tara:strand:- start:10975 stop:11673 length:699 start_codon:yes stop_codon:yes gene_type:complete
MAKHIAIVEDDPDQRANYRDAITMKGYDVAAYGSREEAMEGIEGQMPDLVILDIILGDEVDAGFQLCRELLTKSPSLPVIFLTERINEIDKISGLRLGAWDYLPKPISLDYLAERISSLLRINEVRSENPEEESPTARHIGELTLDQEALLASWKGERIDLSGTEFRMLAKLVRMPGHAVSYETLMNATMQSLVTNNTINTHMRNIRKKFEKVDGEFACIKSEYGFGYRWSE